MNQNPTDGILLCVSGPSGVGKGTVIHRLQQRQPDIIHSVSATTRPMREGEQDGVSYHFLSRDRFEDMIQNGDILEYDEYCGNYYGTPRTPLQDALAQGHNVVMDVTVPGSLSVIHSMPDTVSIFLLPPSFGELRRRLNKRGTERPEEREKRLEKALDEIRKASLFKYVVVNDDLEQTVEKILAIEKAERCRYSRNTGMEQTLLTESEAEAASGEQSPEGQKKQEDPNAR